MAPLVVGILAFLTGGGGTLAVEYPFLTAAAKSQAVVAGVYANLPLVCDAMDAPLDLMTDLRPNSKALARIVRVSDAVCAAAKKPNNPIDQAGLVVAAIDALNDPAVLAVIKKATP